jgi:tetratricopeptide (TPR) repeat protein/predicted Ser/Thr protein kinase
MGETIRVPGYALAERIGAGGFGEVFRARQDVIGRDVAIKVLHAKYSADPEAVARFVAEARAVGQLSHAGIVELFELGELDDGRQFFVMELLRGKTLREVLRERTRISLGDAIPILRGIAEAIDAAHAAGIAHRDLKPDNVFVLDDGRVKLIDFGLAKLTRDADTPVTKTGSVFGTPLYMSPEQCRGKAVDTRTDCYSFGVLAYHVLVGEPPWTGDALELALHHLNDAPDAPSKRNPELSDRVDRVVLSMLAKDPGQRPVGLASAIAAITGDAALPRVPRRRRRLAWSVVPALAITGIGVWVATRTTPAPVVGDTCATSAARLVGIWDGPRRASLAKRYAASTRDLSRELAMILADFDDFGARWSARWDAACHSPDQRADPLLYAQRMTCLENVLIEFRGRSDRLAAEDPWHSASYYSNLALDPPEDCDSVAILRAQGPTAPPGRLDEITRAWADFDRAHWAVMVARSGDQPLAVPQNAELAALETLVTLEAPGATAAFTLHVSELLPPARHDPSSRAAIRSLLQRAIRYAEAHHEDVHLPLVLVQLITLERMDGADRSKLDALFERADAALVRAGNPSRSAAELALAHADFDAAQHRFPEAFVAYDRAIAASNPRWLHLRNYALIGASTVRAQYGDRVGAVERARELVTAVATRFGDDFWMTAEKRIELARRLMLTDDARGALAQLDAAIATYSRRFGTHENLDSARLYQIACLVRLGDEAQAEKIADHVIAGTATVESWLALARRGRRSGLLEIMPLALARAEQLQPTVPQHHEIDELRVEHAFMRGDVSAMGAAVRTAAPWAAAYADARAGRKRDAIAALESLQARADSTDPLSRATTLAREGMVWFALERWPDSIAKLDAARTTYVDARYTQIPRDETDAWLGAARVRAGDYQAAIPILDESLEIAASSDWELDGWSYTTPMAQLALARALWETGGDRQRARLLAEAARDGYQRLGPFREPERQQAIDWLAKHTP